jgi:DNA-binding NarL/FixJ family response regulator
VTRSNGLRVLVVDEHTRIARELRRVFDDERWVEHCPAARTQEEAVHLAQRFKPHVALINLVLGRELGFKVSAGIHEASPPTRTLFVAGAEPMSAQAARAAGAWGLAPTGCAVEDLARAVRLVAVGMMVFEAEVRDAPPRLSPRETMVLGLIASGATNREIAARLFLSPHTVKDNTTAIYRKLGVRNRAQAARRAEHLGLTTLA